MNQGEEKTGTVCIIYEKARAKMLSLAWKFKYMYENMLTIIHLHSSHHFLSTWGAVSFKRKKNKDNDSFKMY